MTASSNIDEMRYDFGFSIRPYQCKACAKFVRNRGCAKCTTRLCKECFSTHHCSMHSAERNNVEEELDTLSVAKKQGSEDLLNCRMEVPALKQLFVQWRPTGDVAEAEEKKNRSLLQELPLVSAASPTITNVAEATRVNVPKRKPLSKQELNDVLVAWDAKCRREQAKERLERATEILAIASRLGAENDGAFATVVARAEECLEQVQQEMDGAENADDLDAKIEEIMRSMYSKSRSLARKKNKQPAPAGKTSKEYGVGPIAENDQNVYADGCSRSNSLNSMACRIAA